MKRKFDDVRFERIFIIVEIGSPTQYVQRKENSPKPKMILKLDVEFDVVKFTHLEKTILMIEMLEHAIKTFATLIILSIKNTIC